MISVQYQFREFENFDQGIECLSGKRNETAKPNWLRIWRSQVLAPFKVSSIPEYKRIMLIDTYKIRTPPLAALPLRFAGA